MDLPAVNLVGGPDVDVVYRSIVKLSNENFVHLMGVGVPAIDFVAVSLHVGNCGCY